MSPTIKENLFLPTVALRGLVVFPEMTLHFDIGRKQSVSAVKSAMLNRQNLFLIAESKAVCGYCTRYGGTEICRRFDGLFSGKFTFGVYRQAVYIG